MGEIEYLEALKAGKKEYKACLSSGRFPYLPVLDEILSHEETVTEQKMGLVTVPLDLVVGTSTMGRTFAFAANFMPILPSKSEFGLKWAHLADAQVTEGIRDPIKAYEYMNRYYVLEGNKRVSVLKYFRSDSIPAIVTRKVPAYSEDDENIRLYYEFMKFNEITGLYTIEFTRLGTAQKLLELMGRTDPWDDDTKEEFSRIRFLFQKAYEFHGGAKLPITLGDALVAFMSVYGFDHMLEMTEAEYNANVSKLWGEFVLLTQKEQVGLVMAPDERRKGTNLLSYFLPSTTKKLTVAFLYTKDPDSSDWVYGHELGRNYLEETFPKQLETICVTNVSESNFSEVLESVIGQGAGIIFGTAPQMMKPSLKAAVEHPQVKILNCSLNTPHRYIRTYYGRMYEAKFVSGVIAGAMAENDKVAYVADYPIFGMIANINAFALGAASVNPRVKIYLAWSTRKDYDLERFMRENDIHYVSDQDMITPRDPSRRFGLYRLVDGEAQSLGMTLWNWGIFYEKMIQSILAGSYQSQEQEEQKALNYWWGMSAGVIDLICSKHVPGGVKQLAEHLKRDLCDGDLVPFYGEIFDQKGNLRNHENTEMSPEEIMKMDWLASNVVGEIPPVDELIDDAHSVVNSKGVEDAKLTEE